MSSCSFQTQFMSVMELLAKAAVEEIQRHVNDSCAFMRVELNRSRSDVDALKRKCVIMENELRRVKLGRNKRRVWVRTYNRDPTPRRTVCVSDDDVIRDQDENPEPVLNIHQVISVLDDEIRSPVIKREGDEVTASSERENVSFILEQQDLQRIQPSPKSLSVEPEVQIPSFTPTQTSVDLDVPVNLDEDYLSGLRLQVKDENIIKEEGFERDSSVSEPDCDGEPHHSRNTEVRRINPVPVERKQQRKTSTIVGSHGAVHRIRSRRRWNVDLVSPFSCSFCEKSFKHLYRLKEHLRSHTGEKPFTCAQCGRSFTKNCNLIRHTLVHSGEKPFWCVRCGKCFSQRSSLKSHQRLHSGDGDDVG